MMKSLCLFSLVFHMAAGCALSGENKWLEITGHERGSVLLPCSCSDLHFKPQRFTWKSHRTGHLTEVLKEERYRGRPQMFNNISAANLSLLISDLKEEDGGDYRCSTEKGYNDFWLNVKGCELVKKTVVEEVTGFIGESVFLPCFCSNSQDDSKTVTWEFNYQEIYHEQTRYHRKRMKLVSKTPPGNLSLLISDLTEEDQGIYTCSVQGDKKKFRLYVKERKETTQPNETDKTAPIKQPQSKLTNSSASLTSASSTQGRKNQEAPANPPPASSISTQGQTKKEVPTNPPPASSSSTRGQKPQETPTNPPPAPSLSTQVQKPQGAPKKPSPALSSTPMEQDEHQNYSILPLIVVLLLLMFVLVAFICWRCRGARSGAYMITANRLDFCKGKQEDQLVTGDTLFATVNYTCDPTDPH